MVCLLEGGRRERKVRKVVNGEGKARERQNVGEKIKDGKRAPKKKSRP